MSLAIVLSRAQVGVEAPAVTVETHLADLPKDGGRFDLAIALGLLAASAQVPTLALDGVECLGELALSGAIRPVQGVLPAALAARAAGHTLIVPAVNAEEACLASGLKVIAVSHLLELVAHLNGHTVIEPYKSNGLILQTQPYPDLSEVPGADGRQTRPFGRCGRRSQPVVQWSAGQG